MNHRHFDLPDFARLSHQGLDYPNRGMTLGMETDHVMYSLQRLFDIDRCIEAQKKILEHANRCYDGQRWQRVCRDTLAMLEHIKTMPDPEMYLFEWYRAEKELGMPKS